MTILDHLQTCKACNHEFRAPDKLLGKKVACPFCRRLVEVTITAGPNDPLVGQLLGGCRLVRRLGAGAIGVVYEAEQVSMNRRVAMKMLSSKSSANPMLVQRFQREAKLSAQISHPHVVQVFDCGFERSVHFLTMELVDGTTLAGMVDENGPMPWQQASALMLQVARAVDHVAGQNIVHRDIKPANILVSSQGQAKLADLGLAKQTDADEGGDQALTMQGAVLGSPAYMSPEQIRNSREASHIADLYSLGATFYHLLAGVPPFDGRTATEVMTKVLREPPAPLRTLVPLVPHAIAGFVHRTLAKTPKERPQTAAQFVEELKQALTTPERAAGTPTPRAGVPVQGRSERDAARSPLVTILIALVITAVLAAVYFAIY
ncbi:MAG: serine/threonine protein kinase [Planctomycetes bacterium]|nr:serine/threonine protein kinase [Planctomycetota bacterium]